MAKFKILVADNISQIGIDLLSSIDDLEVVFTPKMSQEEVLETIGEYDALIVRSRTKARADVIAAGKKLKVIGRAGVGVDNIDREAASSHGVIVMNTPTGNTISTAELAFTLMLSAARNIGPSHKSIIEGRWDRKLYQGIEMFNKRLAVIGMGRIGAEFAKRAQAFGMHVVAYDPFLTQARADEMKVELVESPDLALTGADAVTLHVPLNDSTKNIINAERLALMNKGAIVVNCARGGLVDEQALSDAIASGHIAGCGLDVYTEEPPSAEMEIFSHGKHTAFTPHLGASTNEAQENVGIQVAEQVRDFLVTGEIRNAINMPSLDAQAAAEIGQYLDLGKALGTLLGQLGPENPEALRISYHGPLAEKDTALVSRTVLCSLLESHSDAEVNIVNAPEKAKIMGLDLVESTINAKTEYSDLLVAELRKGDAKYRVAGTVIGQTAKVVEIDKIFVDMGINGNFLIVKNDDRKGIVGKVGTTLAENDFNIANMSLARNCEILDGALSIIELDSVVDVSLCDTLKSLDGVTCVRSVVL